MKAKGGGGTEIMRIEAGKVVLPQKVVTVPTRNTTKTMHRNNNNNNDNYRASNKTKSSSCSSRLLPISSITRRAITSVLQLPLRMLWISFLLLLSFDGNSNVRAEVSMRPGHPVLESRWALHEPGVFYCADGSDFMFRFGMSNYIENHMITFGLFRESPDGSDACGVDIWNNAYLTPQVVYDDTPIGDGSVVRQVILALKPDVNLLSVSPVYNLSPDGTAGYIKFCIKASISTKDMSAIVNFKTVKYFQSTTIAYDIRRRQLSEGEGEDDSHLERESLAESNTLSNDDSQHSHRKLATDCSEGYDIVFENWWDLSEGGTAIEPVDIYNVSYTNQDGDLFENPFDDDALVGGDGGTSNVEINIAPQQVLDLGGGNTGDNNGTGFQEDLSFLVEAYRCDGDNNDPVDETDPALAVIRQGGTLKICVKPDPDALRFGLVLKQIDTCVFSKPELDVVQYAVDGGLPDFYGLSEVDCPPGEGRELCSVNTMLRSDFFINPGYVNVAGTVSFQFRSVAQQQRKLQESNEEEEELLDLQRRRRFLQEAQQQQISEREIGRFSLNFLVTGLVQEEETQQQQQPTDNKPSSLQSYLLIFLSFTQLLQLILLWYIRDARKSTRKSVLQGDDDLENANSYGDNTDRYSSSASSTEKTHTLT